MSRYPVLLLERNNYLHNRNTAILQIVFRQSNLCVNYSHHIVYMIWFLEILTHSYFSVQFNTSQADNAGFIKNPRQCG